MSKYQIFLFTVKKTKNCLQPVYCITPESQLQTVCNLFINVGDWEDLLTHHLPRLNTGHRLRCGCPSQHLHNHRQQKNLTSSSWQNFNPHVQRSVTRGSIFHPSILRIETPNIWNIPRLLEAKCSNNQHSPLNCQPHNKINLASRNKI